MGRIAHRNDDNASGSGSRARTPTLRTLIVDDEPLARRGLEIRLREHADVEVVGQYGDGAAAVAGLREHRPDLVFLDVQMPGMDGFETLRNIPAAQMRRSCSSPPTTITLSARSKLPRPITCSSVEESRLEQALARCPPGARAARCERATARIARLLGELSGHAPLTRTKR